MGEEELGVGVSESGSGLFSVEPTLVSWLWEELSGVSGVVAVESLSCGSGVDGATGVV